MNILCVQNNSLINNDNKRPWLCHLLSLWLQASNLVETPSVTRDRHQLLWRSHQRINPPFIHTQYVQLLLPRTPSNKSGWPQEHHLSEPRFPVPSPWEKNHQPHETSPEFMFIVLELIPPWTSFPDGQVIPPLPPPHLDPESGEAGANGKNGGHGPTSAGNGHFIGWQKKKLWSVQERVQRPGRGQGSWVGARQGQAETSAIRILRGWWQELEREDHNKTMDDNIRNNRQEYLQLKFWTNPLPPTARPHLLEALGLCLYFSAGPRLISSASDRPQDTLGYTMVPTDRVAFLRSHRHLFPSISLYHQDVPPCLHSLG